MAITKEKKRVILDKLLGVVKSPAVVFVAFKGLPVASATELRRTLAERGTKYLVAKKTLLLRALATMEVAGSLPELTGETALAYGDDPLISAKGIYEFEKKTAGQVKIAGGIYEGCYVDASVMTTLAKIPAREVLYGQFVRIINSPLVGLAVVLEAIAKKRPA